MEITDKELWKKIVDEVTGIIGVQANDVTPDSRLVEDFSPDSLELAELALGIEETFNITYPEDDWENVKTVGDIYAFVYNKTKGKTK